MEKEELNVLKAKLLIAMTKVLKVNKVHLTNKITKIVNKSIKRIAKKIEIETTN